MKDLNRRKFEEDWRMAFDEAEVTPSASIWSNLEFDLVKSESDSMKKKVLFYKWLAAASIFLAAFLGGTYYVTNESGDSQITSHEAAQKSDLKNEPSLNKAGNESPENQTSNGNETTSLEKQVAEGNSQGGDKNVDVANSVVMAPSNEKEESNDLVAQSQHATVGRSVKKGRPSATVQTTSYLSTIEETPAVVQSTVVMPRLVLPAMPAAFMASSKKNAEAEDLWASVGVSAGSYNPNYSQSSGGGLAYSSSGSPQASAANSSYSDASNVGSSHSAGFAMSKRVFSRWVLQTGVNYVNQSSEYTSNYLAYSANNQSKVLTSQYADFMSQSVTTTTPYQINSVVEVLSLPLQTGYLLVDRKIGWQLNTGVATDIFIRNTLTDASGNASRLSQGAGDNSPYRSVSWSGLLGTELSYKVAKQYRFSVVPSMRYSVNSVMKSASSNPMVMDIGFRFRYIFK